MELRDYLRAVRKRWWLVAGSVVVALSVASLVTALTPPKYSASVTFFVGAQTKGVSEAYQGSLLSQQRIASYADLLTSDRLAQAIVDNDRTGRSAAQVQAAISATAIPGTVLLEATVTDHDRIRALQLGQSLAKQFVALVRTLETPPGSDVPTVWVEVIAGPSLAAKPVSPTPVRNAGLALVLGLVVGVGAAVLRETLDTSVKNAPALSELTGAAVLSTVPIDARAKRAPLIVAGSAGSVRAEAMRQLRTNLQFVNVDSPARAIAVTSAVPGEGKTTTACNLAIVLAEAGKRVVVVDADLRRPRVAEYLNVEGAVGLTNVLAGQATVDDALQQWGSSGVFVLPAGSIPPNPSELLGSRNMEALLASLRVGFDIVIVDTPPLLPVTDGAVAATVVDGTVMVFRCGRTSTAQVRAAAEALAAVDAPVLGCVLNMTPRRNTGAYTYYDYSPKPAGRHTRLEPAPADSGTGSDVHSWATVPTADLSIVYRSAAHADLENASDDTAPVSPAPVSAAPVSPAPVSAIPVSSVPVSSAPVSAAPVSSAPVTAPPAGRPAQAASRRKHHSGRAKVRGAHASDDTSVIGVARVRGSR
jgi:capsular exopolysaccharide synthesis family protein